MRRFVRRFLFPIAVTNRIHITHPVILRIADLAFRQGTSIYLVGGYVRDALLGRPRMDIDVTVVGDALAFARSVADVFGSHTVEYERFRTAMVPIDGTQFEFVGTRAERYEPGSRNPIVTEGSLHDDLRRRDFTVNAMAASLAPDTFGEVIDLFGGAEDMKAKLLRTPLDPVITMSDDPLRMMRAARFAAQLDFSVDQATFDAITSMADRIGIISQERVTDEFMKILASPRPSVGLSMLQSTGLMRWIFPEVDALAGVDLVAVGNKEYRHKDVFLHTLQVVDNVAAMSENVWLRFATLLHDIAKPHTKRFTEGLGWSFHGHEEIGARWVPKIFKRMKLPLHDVDYVQTLVRLHQRPMMLVDEGVTDSALRRLAVSAGDALEDLFVLCKADVTTKNARLAAKYIGNYDIVRDRILAVRERDHLRAFQSPVRGEEIMALTGLPPSRTVGYLKYMLEEAILEGLIPNDRAAALAYLHQHLDTWIADAATAQFHRRG
ncbi:MAG: CCA tRNA nucleotidyltransferase [Candidatus Kapabacteria bacterium]|jgi:putative nucleotidyltransferase with HDIG domain|nr:CCA tRNA nucleotidyltransferase [Candidatus Kapabacteria bacterium]